jgi:membrane-associated phospholipid phosphatase
MSHAQSPSSLLPERRRPLLAICLIGLAVFLTFTVLVATEWGPLMRTDRALADTFYQAMFPREGLSFTVEMWTEAFGTWAMRVLSVLVALWLVLRRLWTLAAWALATMFLANLGGLVGKEGIDRPRPEFAEPIATGTGASFPSGHALLAVAGMAILLFAVLPLLSGTGARRCAWITAGVIAVSTAASRPLLGVHWMSDVLAGMALGLAVVAASLLLWSFLPPTLRQWDRTAPTVQAGVPA